MLEFGAGLLVGWCAFGLTCFAVFYVMEKIDEM